MTSSADHPRQGLFSHYRGLDGRFDELLDADGGTRPHWLNFVEGLVGLGVEARAEAVETAARLLRQNDLSYLTQGAVRPWKLDLLPLLLPATVWRELESGLVQRARLAQYRRGRHLWSAESLEARCAAVRAGLWH